jgi:hypothetical protein
LVQQHDALVSKILQPVRHSDELLLRDGSVLLLRFWMLSFMAFSG